MISNVTQTHISRTERFAIFERGKIVSRAYIRIAHGDKPSFIFKVKTNKSHIRQGLCRKVIQRILASPSGMYNIELRPHQTEVWGMSLKLLEKFYRSLGFKKKRKGNKYYNTMVRIGVSMPDYPNADLYRRYINLYCPNCEFKVERVGIKQKRPDLLVCGICDSILS